ncbi:hypothetical protein, partial [Rivularia sp. UHCC 0363]|uniref:hypothetical protein n=1 Tax=Rivularia sp. UHCC 0363 TaxID=3110244 RepID=UPI002B20EAE9
QVMNKRNVTCGHYSSLQHTFNFCVNAIYCYKNIPDNLPNLTMNGKIMVPVLVLGKLIIPNTFRSGGIL